MNTLIKHTIAGVLTVRSATSVICPRETRGFDEARGREQLTAKRAADSDSVRAACASHVLKLTESRTTPTGRLAVGWFKGDTCLHVDRRSSLLRLVRASFLPETDPNLASM